MKALEAAAWLIFLVIVGAVAALGYLVYRLVESTVAAVPAVAFQIGGGAALLAFVFVVAGGAIAIVRWMALRSRQIQHKDGLYPQVYHHVDGQARYIDLNAPNAQALAVMHQHRGARAGAASVGRVLDWQPALPELPEPAQAPLTVASVTAVDPRTAPHWLLVGTTGSGKTLASYAILSELARRAPCEFVITEPGGVNWGPQTTATTTPQIAHAILAVQEEMERRQDLLRRCGVDHVQDLAEPLPYLVLVAEETDAVLDDLRLTDRETRTATVIALRAIARMGRKCGVCLMAVSQSGTTDVFDSHVRKNLSNVLLFRSEHTVAETWRAGVKLGDLAPGAAYSVRHGEFVQFPYAMRPALPTVDVEPLELVEPVLEDDGIPVQNWPRTGAVPGGSGGSEAVPGGSYPVLAANEEPPRELAGLMRQWYAAGVSKNELCRRVWPAKNGKTWEMLDRALTGEL